ncbi:MAG: T9SS type A sorting domain-containing protein [Cytophagales bacterium]|nr:T9SS type A sorting domain-containing protein [Cytophagales bacterium]
MKKLIIVLLAVGMAAHNSNAQITLEQSYADNQGLSIIKLENSGHKYLQYDLTNQIVKLYNLDHSIFKTILLPTLQPATQNLSISYISENLFNTDNLIEILCWKRNWQPTSWIVGGSVKIINENGSVVFLQDSMVVVEQRSTTFYGYNDKSSFIYNTTNGTKLILYSYKTNDEGFKVFSLPGTLMASIKNINSDNLEDKFVFPNPANSNITIPYELTESSFAILTIYDTNGKEIQNLKIDKTFKNVFVDVSKFQNGVYLYTIKNEAKLISNGKFIVSK